MKRLKLLPSILLLALSLVSLVAHGADKESYTTMRLEFAARQGYNPYALQAIEKGKINEAMAAWKKGDVVSAFKEFESILGINPVSIETHRRMADGYEVLANDAKNNQQKEELIRRDKKHREIAEGLIKSIISTGDGKSSKSPFKVISIPEEYMALWYLDLTPEKVEVDETGPFDVITAKDREGKTKRVFFDISILKNSVIKK